MARLRNIVSITLITAGLVLLADAGITLVYKEPLSSIYASILQGRAADQLSEVEEGYPTGAELRAVALLKGREQKVAALARRFARRVEVGEAIGRIEAPAMDGLNAVVVQGTDTASLQKGPGHYPETPFPGQGGTVGIAGHRTTFLAPFNAIDSMERGDRVILEMPYATLTYRVQKTAIVDPGDVSVIQRVGYERLVLSACHPLYSAAQRYIVYARLVGERLSAGRSAGPGVRS